MRILLCCGTGMSSSILVKNMREAANDLGLEKCQIASVDSGRVLQFIDKVDVVLVAPQLIGELERIKQYGDLVDVPVLLINKEWYGNMQGEKILIHLLKHVKKMNEEDVKMDKISSWLEKRLMPIAMKLGAQRHLLAIRNGIVLGMPLILVGSLFLILGNLPFDGYTDWLAAHGELDVLFGKIVDGSFGLMGLIASFGIAYNYVKSFNIDGVSAGVISLSSFLIVTPKIFDSAEAAGIPYALVGSSGLFVSIVVGLISGDIFRRFIQKKIVIKMPDTVPPEVSRSFSALIPAFAIISLWGVVYKLIDMMEIGSIHDIILLVFGKPLGFLGGTVFGTILAVGLVSLFWFCGIHGADLVGSIMNPIWLMNADSNRLLYQAGEQVDQILTYPFIYNFVFLGGGGATLALVALLVFRSKSKQLKSLGNLSFAPGLFNINEPAIFGIPITLNSILLIPFVITPMVNVLISYFSMSSGLVAKTTGIIVPWTTPPIISGYLATGGSISGIILQVVLIVVNIGLYYPFFRMQDKQLLAVESAAADEKSK